MPIEFIVGLVIGILIGMDLTLFIQQIKEFKKELRDDNDQNI